MPVRKSLSVVLPVFVILVGMAAPVLLSAMEDDPPAGSEFIVVTPPWERAAQRIALVGGLTLAEGRLPFFALTFAHDASVPNRLRKSGPILFMTSGLETLLCT